MDLDFSKIKYNIHTLSTTDRCIEKYKDLQLYADVFESEIEGLIVPSDITTDFIIRYFILTYTPSSPFVEVYTDLQKRKPMVLEYLGIDKSNMSDSIEKLCGLHESWALFRWIAFLRIQSSEIWSGLCVAEERFYKALETYIEIHTDPTKEKAKNDVLKELEIQIKQHKKDFIAGEKSKIAEEAISFVISAEGNKLSIRPEEYIPIWSRDKKLPYDLKKI